MKNIQKITIQDLNDLLLKAKKRLSVSNSSPQTIANYLRAVESLCKFTGKYPGNTSIDQVTDFIYDLQHNKNRAWRTIKVYTAGLRWYFTHMEENSGLAQKIPYPKEEKDLPKILSREDLKQFFSGCKNIKHRVMFQLVYSSGLRRNELLNLKIRDIQTDDGKFRIRINRSKGNKDRYTVLSQKLLPQLREYYLIYRPKEYLFNGRIKGEPMSAEGLRHAMIKAVKQSGFKKNINLHILRHCFASHALEEGLNIRTLQELLGHSSIQTTMIYLHVSDIPLYKAFSPFDKWRKNHGK
jgi:integrase/recombinase XerD